MKILGITLKDGGEILININQISSVKIIGDFKERSAVEITMGNGDKFVISGTIETTINLFKRAQTI